MLAGLATCSATLDAAPSMLKALAPQNLIVITDFDATLTCGDGPQCHDVLGTAPSLPASLRADFAPLLDFSVPHPPAWHGAKWWERANEKKRRCAGVARRRAACVPSAFFIGMLAAE